MTLDPAAAGGHLDAAGGGQPARGHRQGHRARRHARSATSNCARAASTSASDYGNLLPTYFVVAVIYMLINLALGQFSVYLERRLRTRRGGGQVVKIDAGRADRSAGGSAGDRDPGRPGIDEFKRP